jgi:hypothetical protein
VDPTGGNVASWGQTGAVVLFAAAVLWELRQLRPLIKEWIEQRQADRDLLADVKNILARLLERERMRAEQRTKLLKMRGGEVDEAWDEDVTDAVTEPVPRQPSRPVKMKSPPHGYPITEYGPHTRRKPGDE